MRENRLYGSEGGESQLNAISLPLSDGPYVHSIAVSPSGVEGDDRKDERLFFPLDATPAGSDRAFWEFFTETRRSRLMDMHSVG